MLTADTVDDEAAYYDIIRHLERYSFTERHGRYFRFHPFIRRAMVGSLDPADAQQTRFNTLHLRAAAYYRARLEGYQETQRVTSLYEALYHQLEDPAWQELQREWLYHLGNAPDRRAAWLEFAQTYLLAFQWWGRYHEYPFCTALLADWHDTLTAPADQHFGNLLRTFQAGYPPGPNYRKIGQGDWLGVKRALDALRSDLNLAGDFTELPDASSRQVRVLLDFFLAEACRFGLADPAGAEQLYQAAGEEGATVDDTGAWFAAWMTYMLADLHMEMGDLDRAQAEGEVALAGAEQAEDPELLANSQRVLGDIAWLRGEEAVALRNYSSALYRAYRFQIEPSGPDLYNRQFYQEMRERAVARLQELWGSGQQEAAVRWGRALCTFWRMDDRAEGVAPQLRLLLAEDRVADLQVLLFPRGPQDEELGRTDSDFYYDALDVLERVSATP
jgi:hypothetical protein